MITRTYNFENEKQASLFDKLYVKLKENNKLTVEEVATTYVRLASKEEIISFFTEDDEDLKLIPSDEVFKKYKS